MPSRLTKIIDSQYSDFEYELATRERAKMKVEMTEKTIEAMKAYAKARDEWLNADRNDFESLQDYLAHQTLAKEAWLDLADTFAISAALDIDENSLTEGYYNAA